MSQLVNISVHVPEEILLSLRVNNEELAAQMKALTAIKLCESQKLSIGQSAAFADMSEIDFIKLLGQNKISIFGTEADIADDMKNA